tara:strand:+ start:3386 stop:3568 length:183 start_codon:yes stop_codon:yes gene_type:complete
VSEKTCQLVVSVLNEDSLGLVVESELVLSVPVDKREEVIANIESGEFKLTPKCIRDTQKL